MNEARIHDWIRYVKENAQSVESQVADSQTAIMPAPAASDIPKSEATPKTGRRNKNAITPTEAAKVVVAERESSKPKTRVRQRVETRAEMLDRLTNPVISLHEASVILNVCTATVRRYSADGLLPHERTKGGQRRFRLRAVLALSRQLGGKRRS